MPYSGGVYTVPSGSAATTLTSISSTKYNALIDDLEAAQNAVRPIVAGGTNATSELTFGGINSASVIQGLLEDWGGVNTVAGTGDAITVTAALPYTAYGTSAGQIGSGTRLTVKAPGNGTTAATLNINSIGTKAIRKIVGGADVALVAGDILSGRRLELVYDSTANSAAGGWILLNPGALSVPSLILPGTAAGPASISLAEDTDNGTNKVTVKAASSMAADFDFILPNATGTGGQFLRMNSGATGLEFALALTYSAPINSTSGTAIDFTGIPSWVTRITIIFVSCSTNGTNNWLVQLGDSGGIETTGYTSTTTFVASGSSGLNTSTAGFAINDNSASNTLSGVIVLTRFAAASLYWVADGNLSVAAASYQLSGVKNTSDPLDRVRITTVGATDTFDAGSIIIVYEG